MDAAKRWGLCPPTVAKWDDDIWQSAARLEATGQTGLRKTLAAGMGRWDDVTSNYMRYTYRREHS